MGRAASRASTRPTRELFVDGDTVAVGGGVVLMVEVWSMEGGGALEA